MGARALSLLPGPAGAAGSRPSRRNSSKSRRRRWGVMEGGPPVTGAKGVKAGHKPGSVLRSPAPKRRALGMVICLGPPLPAASSGALLAGLVRWPTVVPGPCSRPGFTEPAPLDAAGALLPHPCTLACALLHRSGSGAIGGVFLWHCPHGHPHWALPSKPGHWGARTFLNRLRQPDQGRCADADRDHLACFHSP